MKEPLAIEVVGVFLSLGMWLSAMKLHLRTQAAAVRRLPDSWRSHPELREGYRLMAELAMCDLLKERTRLAAWLTVLTAFAVCLSLLDILLGVSLAAAVAYATYSTGAEVAETRAGQAEMRMTLGLPDLHRDRSLAVRYQLSLLLLKIGFYLAGLPRLSARRLRWVTRLEGHEFRLPR